MRFLIVIFLCLPVYAKKTDNCTVLKERIEKHDSESEIIMCSLMESIKCKTQDCKARENIECNIKNTRKILKYLKEFKKKKCYIEKDSA